MKILDVKAESKTSKILIGERLANVNKYLIPGRKTIILTDSNILKYLKKNQFTGTRSNL